MSKPTQAPPRVVAETAMADLLKELSGNPTEHPGICVRRGHFDETVGAFFESDQREVKFVMRRTHRGRTIDTLYRLHAPGSVSAGSIDHGTRPENREFLRAEGGASDG